MRPRLSGSLFSGRASSCVRLCWGRGAQSRSKNRLSLEKQKGPEVSGKERKRDSDRDGDRDRTKRETDLELSHAKLGNWGGDLPFFRAFPSVLLLYLEGSLRVCGALPSLHLVSFLLLLCPGPALGPSSPATSHHSPWCTAETGQEGHVDLGWPGAAFLFLTPSSQDPAPFLI